jgi:hypothetical protein
MADKNEVKKNPFNVIKDIGEKEDIIQKKDI